MLVGSRINEDDIGRMRIKVLLERWLLRQILTIKILAEMEKGRRAFQKKCVTKANYEIYVESTHVCVK